MHLDSSDGVILEYTLGNEDTEVDNLIILILIDTWDTLVLYVDVFILIVLHNLPLPKILASMTSEKGSRAVQKIRSIGYQRKVKIGWNKNNLDQFFPNIIIPLQQTFIAHWSNQQEAFFSKQRIPEKLIILAIYYCLGPMMVSCPKIAHVLNLVSDGSTLKQSTRNGDPPRKVALGNHYDNFDIIISRVTYACWVKSISGSLLTDYQCTPDARNMARSREIIYIVCSYFARI